MLAARARPVGLTWAALAAVACAWAPVSAQEGCEFVDPGNDEANTRPPFTYITNPHFRCEGDIEVWGDSAIVNDDQEMFILRGSARYVEGARELRADEVRYFIGVGRVQGRGSVRVSDAEDGSVVENGDLVILRRTASRDVEEMTVTTGDDGVRPRATMVPRRVGAVATDSAAIGPLGRGSPAVDTASASPQPADSVTPPDGAGAEPAAPGPSAEPAAADEPEPYVVVGDRLFFRDDYFEAEGTVEIVQDSLFAFADSARYEGDLGVLTLDGSARVESATYVLVGRRITLTSRDDGSDEVRAVRDALLTGEDLFVTAEQVVLHLQEGQVERMVAVPLAEEAGRGEEPVQAKAISGAVELTGDSLDLVAPAGVLDRIFAVGDARSVSSGRSELNVGDLPEIARQDWIAADTIEVLLVPVAPGAEVDTDPGDGPEDEYQVDRIIARLDARSLYRLQPADSAAVPGVDPPALSYIVARQITIFMVDGQADRVESVGQVSGWHMEPSVRPPPEDATSTEQSDSTSTSTSAPAVPDAPADPPPNIVSDDGGDGPPPDAYLSPGP